MHVGDKWVHQHCGTSGLDELYSQGPLDDGSPRVPAAVMRFLTDAAMYGPSIAACQPAHLAHVVPAALMMLHFMNMPCPSGSAINREIEVSMIDDPSLP